MNWNKKRIVLFCYIVLFNLLHFVVATIDKEEDAEGNNFFHSLDIGMLYIQ